MNTSILILLTAAFTTLITLQTIYPLAIRFGLVDIPNQRKSHQGAIPLIGGIGMFTGLIFSVFLSLDMDRITSTWLVGMLSIVVLGVFDDARDLSIKLRLLIQSLAAFALCIGSGFYLESIGDLFGFGNIYLGWPGYFVTVIAVLGGMNAFNMMDGIDGLAGSMAFISLTGLGLLFHFSGSSYGLTITSLLLMVIVPYLIKNLQIPPFKNKIFMGDAGSMLLGFCIVWLLIYGSQHNAQSLKPVTALWLIALPLMDMSMVMAERYFQKKSPFLAGRDHFHHILLNRGFSQKKTLLLMILASAILTIIGIALDKSNIPESLSFFLFILTFAGFIFFKKSFFARKGM